MSSSPKKLNLIPHLTLQLNFTIKVGDRFMMKSTLDNIQIISIKDQFYSENILVVLDNLNMEKPLHYAYCL